MEERKKYNNKALLGTLVFHGVILLVFFLFGLTTPLPLPEEEGVMVSLGVTDQGMGVRQPLSSSPPPPQPQPTRSTQPAEDIATQESDESVALPDSRRDRPREQTTPTPEPTRPQPETTQTPEPDPEPQVDPRALFPGRDRQSTADQNQGETGQTGNQGRADGSPDGAGTVGGGSGGPEFSLTGRSANSLPIPEYASSSQGKVVVSITVNRNGEVTRATAGARGTTTSDRILWAAAEKAAMRARFNVKNDAPHEQTGFITYNFIRLN
jgi:outer membrane biosynthesis protein TonB